MPLFSFYRLLDDGGRVKLHSRELPDREAAEDFGIGLAEELLHAQERDDLPIKSRIVIYDYKGEDLIVIISEGF